MFYINSLTSAHGLLAAPPQGLLAHAGPRPDQLVARLTQEVDLVSDAEDPAQPAAVSGGLGFGAGSWKEKLTGYVRSGGVQRVAGSNPTAGSLHRDETFRICSAAAP